MIIKQNKLLLIEILRFVSAISILIWHYQHFSFKSYTPINYKKKRITILIFGSILRNRRSWGINFLVYQWIYFLQL